MKHQIAIIKGDGIGPEIVNQALKVLEAVATRFDRDFRYTEVAMGACAIDRYGVPITQKALQTCAESDAILLGAIGDPRFDNDPSAKMRPEQGLLQLRKHLGLHTNVRPIHTYPEIAGFSPLKREIVEQADLVIYRELIGGIYFGDKWLSEDGSRASDLCAYSVEQIEAIAHPAFRAAQQRKGHLTLVDKANVLETSRLWRREVTRIGAQYPDVELDFMFVDNAAMQVVRNPGFFDVVLTSNMFGDIISDLASVITGSIGMLPSASIGDKTGLFEPIHGSYPQAKGKDIANPMATILATAMLLDHLGLAEEAKAVRNAIQWALAENIVTEDLDPDTSLGCNAIGDIVSEYIERGHLTINRRVVNLSRGVFL